MQEEIETNKMGKYVSKSRQILLVFFGVTIVYIYIFKELSFRDTY